MGLMPVEEMKLTCVDASYNGGDGRPHEAQDDAGPGCVEDGDAADDAVDHVACGLDDVVEQDHDQWVAPAPEDLEHVLFDLLVAAGGNRDAASIHDFGQFSYNHGS
tara:strand:- start:10078 stop:10395 length:318 start_codon:yes stop_codon:yes gene_type:complete